MVLHISLWTKDEGAPVLLCQHPRDDTSILLPVLSATNGVFSFTKHQGSTLKYLESENVKIVWKEITDDLRLIFIRSEDGEMDDDSSDAVLQLTHLALQMSCSEEDLRPDNEDLRWYIKPAVSRVQHLIQSICSNDSLLGDLMMLPDIVIIDNYVNIQSYLDAFCKGIGVQYASLNIFGRRAACTPQWHLLSAPEQVLLCMLGRQLGAVTSRVDMPLYVPSLSRKIPFRFILLTLIHGVDIILICGSHPPLIEISAEVRRFWIPSATALRTALHSIPSGLPPTAALPPEVTGFALLDRSPGNSLCLASATHGALAGSGDGELDLAQRRRLLRDLVRKTEAQTEWEAQLIDEGYYATSDYRAYFVRREARVFLVILQRNVPVLATGSIAESALSVVQKLLPPVSNG